MTTAYESLNAVNTKLSQLGLDTLSQQESSALLNNVKRHHFTEALDQASTRPDTMSWLKNVITRAKVDGAAGPANEKQAAAKTGRVSHPEACSERSHTNPSHAPGNATVDSSEPSPANLPKDAENRSSSDFMSHHVYGSKAALCWQVDETRRGISTLRLEAAKSIGERQYDWKNKIAIQLTREELPHVAAVLMGLLSATKGSNHGQGDQAGKGFEIQHQGSNVFVRVFGANKGACAVPVSAADTFEISGLIMRQLLKDRPWLNGSDVLMLLKATVARMGQGL